MLDFVLMTPIYQGVDGITCWCVEKAHQAGLNNFLWVPGTWGKGDALICRSRSIMATTFMEFGESNYMIFLDSDIVFTPEQLQALNNHQRKGYDIVGGIYPVRSGTDWSHYFWKGKAPKEFGVHDVQFLSTGFMGISKYALQKIAKEYRYPDGRPLPLLHPEVEGYRSYPFFEATWMHGEDPDAKGTIDWWLSEDWNFCEKARSVGLRVYADTNLQLGHQGHRIVTGLDVEKFKVERLTSQTDEDVQKRMKGEYTDYVAESTEGAEG